MRLLAGISTCTADQPNELHELVGLFQEIGRRSMRCLLQMVGLTGYLQYVRDTAYHLVCRAGLPVARLVYDKRLVRRFPWFGDYEQRRS